MGTSRFENRPETASLTGSAGGVNLGLRSLVEIGAYASFAYWGVSTGTTELARVALAVLAPLVAVVVWTLYLAPRARRRLADPAGLSLELVIFLGASAALATSGLVLLPAIFAGVAVANTVLIRVFGHQGQQRATV